MNSTRRDLVSALSARSAAIVDAITALVEQRVDALAGDADDDQWVRTSAQTNVELLLQVMAYPDELARVEPPLGGVALVRRIAQREVPFYELVRGYQLAEWYWVQQCLRELAELTADTDTLVSETIAVHGLVRGYIDRVCHGLSAEYEAERERWRRRADSARAGVVSALLRGASVGPAEAEATLGYRLGQRHLAAIVWATEAGDDPAGARQVVANLIRSIGSPGRPLVVARDDATLWAWVPFASSSTPDLATTIADSAGVRVALGEPAPGVDGFVTSHRQAAIAFEVGTVAGADVGSVFPYREVSGLALLCADIPRARAWVRETLGPLAAPGRRATELRRTVCTYTAAQCSATATARLLTCHKNTVQYRIRAAERLLGHRVDSGGTNLALALLACRWLGDTILGRADPAPATS